MTIQINSKDGTQTFRFWMTDRVHTRLKFLSKQTKISMSRLINELLEESLDRRNETQSAKSTSSLLELATRAEEFKWAMPTDVPETRDTAFTEALESVQNTRKKPTPERKKQ